MSIQITLTYPDAAAAATALSRLAGAISPAQASLAHPPASPGASSTAVDDQHAPDPTTPAAPGPTTAVAPAPAGKPKKPAAAPAPAPAAASAPSAEPAQTAAPSDSAEKVLTYDDLQQKVLALYKLDSTAPTGVAKTLGLPNFKPLKEPGVEPERIAAAHAAVVAKLAEMGV